MSSVTSSQIITHFPITAKIYSSKYVPQPNDSQLKVIQKISILIFSIIGLFTLIGDLCYYLKTSLQPIDPQPHSPIQRPLIKRTPPSGTPPSETKFWTNGKKIVAGTISILALCYLGSRVWKCWLPLKPSKPGPLGPYPSNPNLKEVRDPFPIIPHPLGQRTFSSLVFSSPKLSSFTLPKPASSAALPVAPLAVYRQPFSLSGYFSRPLSQLTSSTLTCSASDASIMASKPYLKPAFSSSMCSSNYSYISLPVPRQQVLSKMSKLRIEFVTMAVTFGVIYAITLFARMKATIPRDHMRTAYNNRLWRLPGSDQVLDFTGIYPRPPKNWIPPWWNWRDVNKFFTISISMPPPPPPPLEISSS